MDEINHCNRLVFAVSGASGMPLALVLLRALRGLRVDAHLILSRNSLAVMREECACESGELTKYAAAAYEPEDFAAPPSSGSWPNLGMIICPCSMSSLGHIAHGSGVNLIHRAADVCLKERRKLLVVTRETPLSDIHLKNMLAVSRAGGIVFPFCPSFYNHPASLDDMLENTAGRILDVFGIEHRLGRRWQGAARV